MSFLLKIVEGPMNGAEIALVSGLRVRVGSGENCDIVLADASLPEAAFELDVSADSVSLVRGEDVRTLVPFEVFEVGTSAFVIGPAEGAWEPLKRGVAAGGEGDGRPGPSAEGAGEAASAGSAAPAAPAEPAAGREPSERPSSEEAGAPRPRRRGLLVFCVLILLLLAASAAVWFFWPRLSEVCSKCESCRAVVEKVEGLFGAPAREVPVVVEPPAPTLADVASQYGLVLTNGTAGFAADGSPVRPPVLRGNLARRTERMAIRSLAQAIDPSVRLELTDDETLAAAASELLFVVTEGAIKVASASNCVVTLTGWAPSAESLLRTIRALDADVRGLRNVVAKDVTVGGTQPAPKSAVGTEQPQAPKAPRSRGTKTATSRDYPIAGILTRPYGMVVLNNGMRLVEGAQIGGVTIERIEADRLVLRQGPTVFEWKP